MTTEAPQALPRPVSEPSELTLILAEHDRDCLYSRTGHIADINTMLINREKLRTLVSERDAIAVRVRELEAERDRLTLTKIERECLRIGQEIQRAAGELPDGYEMEIEIERGSGSVYLSKPDYSKVSFHDMVDGLSYAITGAIDAALTTNTSGAEK